MNNRKNSTIHLVFLENDAKIFLKDNSALRKERNRSPESRSGQARFSGNPVLMGNLGRGKDGIIMSENITKYVEQVVSKLTGNNGLIEQFKKNPVKIVTDILGIKLDDKLIQAVQGKLNITDVAKNAGGILAKIKSLFGK